MIKISRIALLMGVCMTPMVGANATPGLQIEVFDGNTPTPFFDTSVSTTGSAFLNLNDVTNPNFDPNFSSVIVSVNGFPLIPSPNLNSTTIDASSIAPSTLTVLVTQTGLSVPLENLASTFTFNGLTGQMESGTFQNWIDVNDTPFGMTTPITSAVTLTPDVGNAGPITIAEGPLGLFSETEEYTINFGGAQQSVSLSSQIIDAPEPMSIALLGVGLGALGIVRRNRRA
jgi:hypothetical protein